MPPSELSEEEEENRTLDISDVEIAGVLKALNLEKPDFLPVDTLTEPGSRPTTANTISLDSLVTSLLSYTSTSAEPAEDPFVRIRDMLVWCREWWEEKEKQEAEAKRQRWVK